MVYIIFRRNLYAIMFFVQLAIIHKTKTPRISVNGGRRWLTLQGIKFPLRARPHTIVATNIRIIPVKANFLSNPLVVTSFEFHTTAYRLQLTKQQDTGNLRPVCCF